METKITHVVIVLIIFSSILFGQKGTPFNISMESKNLPEKYGEFTINLDITPQFKCENVSVKIQTFGNINIQHPNSWEESFSNKEKAEYQFIVSIPDNDTTGFEIKVQSGKIWHSAYRYFVTTGKKLKVFKGNPQFESKPPSTEMKIKIEGYKGQKLPSELPNYKENKIEKVPENKVDIKSRNYSERDTILKQTLIHKSTIIQSKTTQQINTYDTPLNSVALPSDLKNENGFFEKGEDEPNKSRKTEMPIQNKFEYLSVEKLSSISSTTIFSDNFGGSHPGSWSIGHDGGGGTYAWAWPNGYAHCYANPSGGMYYYPDNLHVFMERRNVSLSGYSSATLSFNLIVDTEDGFDKFSVNVKDQNGSWHEMYVESGITDPLNWEAKNINLNQFAGQTGLYIQFRFDSDGSVSGSPYDGVYIDGVSLTAEQSQPNLAAYTPSGWDYPIVPSSVSGTHTVSALFAEQTTYIDWAVENNGGQNINTTFYTALYIDNTFITDWSTASLQTNYHAYVEDYVRDLSEGWHNLKIVADYTGNISESNESDNSYNRDFYWEPNVKPNLIPYAPSGWDFPIVPSSVPGTNTVNTLFVDQTSYTDWCVKNTGSANAAQFYTALYIDNNFITDWIHSSGLQMDHISKIEDYELPFCPAEGYHTLKIVTDYLNEVAESNESDNEYSKQFYWEPAGTIVISAWIRFTNHNPMQVSDARRIKIEIWDQDLIPFDDLLWSGYTDNTGHFTSDPISNTELLQGTQDIYLKIFAENEACWVTNGLLGGTYYLYTEVINNISDGVHNYGTLSPSSDADAPFFIADVLLTGIDKWKNIGAFDTPSSVHVNWPCETIFTTSYGLNIINIRGDNDPNHGYPDSFDDDVILHEYGHKLEDNFGFFNNSPGGEHAWNSEISMTLAASEGFAHLWSSFTRNDKTQYNWWMDNNGEYTSNNSFNLENGDWLSNGWPVSGGNANALGNDCEASVGGMLWDLYDSNNDDQNGDGIGDVYNGSTVDILSVLINRNINGHHPDHSDEFFDAWLSSPAVSSELAIGEIWYEHGDFDRGMPVELTTFTVAISDNSVELSWETATEINNYGFEIERKISENWSKIGFVEGNGTTNSPKKYLFTDFNLTSGKRTYRLKQIDQDGKFNYSKIVELSVVQTPKEFSLSQNFPNPYNPSTTLRYGIPERSSVKLTVYNMIGQTITQVYNGIQEAGYHEHLFNASNLPSGVYLYRIDAVSQESPNKTYSNTRKMVLMK